MQSRIRRWSALPAFLLLGAVVPLGAPAQPAAAEQPGCRVEYSTPNQFHGGFVADILIHNDGPATNGWRLEFTFPSASQRLSTAFSARWSQNGQAVTALSQTWNARIPAGSSVRIGFVGAVVGANPHPTDLRITGCGDDPFPPTPFVTSPTEAFPMREGQVTTLRAETLGFPGAVQRIEFRVNGALLGTATTTPFAFVWYPLPAGTHAITATAYDDVGTVATSAPIMFTVRPASAG